MDVGSIINLSVALAAIGALIVVHGFKLGVIKSAIILVFVIFCGFIVYLFGENGKNFLALISLLAIVFFGFLRRSK